MSDEFSVPLPGDDKANSFLRDDEVFDLDSIGEESKMSDMEAKRAYSLLYRVVGASSEADKATLRKTMYAWVCLNSTSTRADLTSTIVAGGKRVRMNMFFNSEVVPQMDMRRFYRASPVNKELEQVARHPGMRARLIRRAQEKGVDPQYYVVVVDVADKFNLSPAERVELARVKASVIAHSATNEKPQVSRAVSDGVFLSNTAPPPSAFGHESVAR